MAESEEERGAAVELSGLPPDFPDELLTLYFENHRRSGGGPVLGWRRLGRGGVLTFQEAADAARVLAQQEHVLQGVRLSLRPAPPRAPARLLLQGLPPGTSPRRLERHVRDLLCAAGLPDQSCRVLASPRPDRALVQLAQPLSEAEVLALEEQAWALDLEGAPFSLAPVPQARAVRVVGGPAPLDPLLLQLYLESERRSGGGALDGGLRGLPGSLGTVAAFQQWQVAERVLRQEHRLQSLALSLVPHYDFLEPEEPAEDAPGGERSATWGPETSELALLQAGEPEGVGAETLGSEGAPPGPSGAPERTEPLVVAVPIRSGPEGFWDREEPENQGLPESRGPAEPLSSRPVESLDLGGAGETVLGPPEPGGSPEPEPLAETVLPMEPGPLRFLQLHHQDLLAGLADEVALFPLEEADGTGFRLRGAPAPCQAAEEFLQSLRDSVLSHELSLRPPGSARFLRGPEGQRLLQELEARFGCVFGTERLARDVLDAEPAEADPTEALLALPGQSLSPWPPDGTGSDSEEDLNLAEVRELLATLEGLDGQDRPPLEPGEEEPQEQPPEQQQEEEEVPEAPTPDPEVPVQLEEEAALQLALHRSLEPQGRAAEREEALALQRALALSLLEPTPLQAEVELLGGGPGTQAQQLLLVHGASELDLQELHGALEAALEAHLREETVRLRGHPPPPPELRARLEQRHGVSLALHEDRAVLRGFGAQPARAARHLRALMAGGARGQSSSPPPPPSLSEEAANPEAEAVADAGGPPQQREGDPWGRLERLPESDPECQAVVQAFEDTLDATYGRIRIVRVDRVRHPLLEQQYALHRERLEARCERRPAERVLYHGTSASAVPEICASGFNRSFCGRNGTLYGQGVYFALRASLSVQDRYSPPDAAGRKAVFVARVLTGDYGPGQRELRAPPPRAPGAPRYDSAVDCVRQPSVFVIFHDTQALPTHLITCEHLPRTRGDAGGSPAAGPL